MLDTDDALAELYQREEALAAELQQVRLDIMNLQEAADGQPVDDNTQRLRDLVYRKSSLSRRILQALSGNRAGSLMLDELSKQVGSHGRGLPWLERQMDELQLLGAVQCRNGQVTITTLGREHATRERAFRTSAVYYPQRGSTPERILVALREYGATNAQTTLSPSELQQLLLDDGGREVPFSSVTGALAQLHRRNLVTSSGRGRWYLAIPEQEP
jgi:hypothetical protein